MPTCLPKVLAEMNYVERIQGLATLLVTGPRQLLYKERLQRRRIRTDLLFAAEAGRSFQRIS